MRTVIGLFGNAGEARRAIEELQGLGYTPDKISVVTNAASLETIESRKPMGLQSLNLADVGKVSTGGPLRDVLSKQPGPSSALGAALQRFGLTAELADHYVSGVRHGETLETLTVDDEESDRVLAVMRRRSASPPPLEEQPPAKVQARQETRKEASAPAPAAGAATKMTNGHALEMDERDEERVIPVLREEMRVGRRTVERGGVRVSSHVVEKPVSEGVHLRETHVDVERRACDRPLRADENAFVDDAVEMVEMADEPVVSKQVRVVEEVIVRRHVEDRTATISDKVRSTEIEFGKLRAFDADEYRRHFDSKVDRSAGAFESYLPAYQFGHELHQGSRGKKSADRWEEIEPAARERWEASNAGSWDKFRESIKHAWVHARAK